MTERVIAILNALGIGDWRVTETSGETAELYFVKKKLDIPRIKKLDECTAEVFRDMEEDGKKLRGSSNALLGPGMTDEEIGEKLRGAYYAASFVKNPWYPLPDPVREPHRDCDSDLAGMDTAEAAVRLAKGMFEADDDPDGFINSAEIFVTRKETRITASNGLEVSFGSCEASGELVTQCIAPADVEQYRDFSFDSLNVPGLQKIVRDAVRDVKARARSTGLPRSGNYDVILTGSNLREVLNYYYYRSMASMIYPGYSSWKTGLDVQGGETAGEKLDLTLIPSDPYSAEGIPMTERQLLKDGVLRCVHGPARFCSYLGTEPTGFYRKLRSGNGTVSYDSMKKEGVLEPVSFSDFQMDFFDGHFKGEIRLALLHHADGTVEELTGGSVNGSITDAQDRLLFSTERVSDASYDGPFAVLIPGVPVAGG